MVRLTCMPPRLLCVLFVLACSSASTPAPTPQEVQPTTRAPSAVVDLKALTVSFDNMPIARLHADGRTESVGDAKPGKDATFSPGPTLHPDGTIELTKPGFTARVDRDGAIYVVSPPGSGRSEQLYGRISGDQLLTAGARDTGVRLEGSKLVMFYEGRQTNVIGVIDPPHLGRTALLMTAAFFIDLAITSR
ncbi:MAG: hypothetical protein M3680_13805 [Myxococcota bacterium]|nr:hypothetical protein [Myxococcota bacterium]